MSRQCPYDGIDCDNEICEIVGCAEEYREEIQNPIWEMLDEACEMLGELLWRKPDHDYLKQVEQFLAHLGRGEFGFLGVSINGGGDAEVGRTFSKAAGAGMD